MAVNPYQNYFNTLMNSSRISVEWGFEKVHIASLFAFVNYVQNIEIYLQPVGLYYKVATILAYCHICLYGSETGDYFGVDPPSLEEYLQ